MEKTAQTAVKATSLMEEGDNEGYTPLHLAVIAGNTNIIRSKYRDLKGL